MLPFSVAQQRLRFMEQQEPGNMVHALPVAVRLSDQLDELFAAQAKQTPDKVAVVWREQHLTYHVLNERADQLAHHLRRLGAGQEKAVGIGVERSLEMVIGVLGILKAGGAYVPLDPTYPPERLRFMAQDAQLSVLITQHHLVDKIPVNQECAILYLDTDWEGIQYQSDIDPSNQRDPDQVAYILYTSGSTGKPKGVIISHRALVNHSTAVTKAYDLEPTDRVLQFASISFDVAAEELYPSWLNGATVILQPSNELTSFGDFLQFLTYQQITFLNLPASYWHEWVAYLAHAQETVPSSLRGMVVGSETVAPDRLALWQQQVGCRVRWWNAYGPTESTITATVYEQLGKSREVVPIGRPLTHITTYILDPALHPVPVGMPGELYIGGKGLAHGYWHQPALSAERFIPDPFSLQPGSRLYKTGDLARCLPDGHIEFLGRLDQQGKIRGFRIEFGEIETALRQYSGVHEAVVLIRADASQEEAPSLKNKQLVAYIVPNNGRIPSIKALHQFLADRLPGYMVPSTFVWLERFPLTPNGKIDRLALPAPDKNNSVKSLFVAPRTPVEELLAPIWKQVLGVEQVSVHDNFFELGGHSLLGVQLISRISDIFHVQLALSAVFEFPTIATLAAYLETICNNGSLQLPPIQRNPQQEFPPLSFAQQQLWLIDQLQPGNIAYNIPTPLQLTGSLDISALHRALHTILQRHETLRTCITIVHNKPAQHIIPVLALPLPVIDLSWLSETDLKAEAERLTRTEGQLSFNLAQAPLVRTTLLQLEKTKHILLLTMHHIITDGWSLDVFLQEMATLYNAFVADQPSPLLPLPIQYADFAVWQQDWLQGNWFVEQLAFWKTQLANIPSVLKLPTDHPRPSIQTFQGSRQPLGFTRPFTESLRSLGQEEQVTWFMILLAAFKALLFRYTGQHDIIVGVPIANRPHYETEPLIGYFVNILALRTSSTEDLSFRQLLRHVRQTTLEAYAHKDVPFPKVVESLKLERSLAYNPIFQVTFTFQNTPQTKLEITNLTATPIEVDIGAALFDLRLELSETEQGVNGFIEYSTDLFERDTVRQMVAHYQTLLQRAINHPDESLSSLLVSIHMEHKNNIQPQPGRVPSDMKRNLSERKANLLVRQNRLTAEQQKLFEKHLQGK